VALENDHRLRELTALREAAEDEKRSLLRRLGRTESQDAIVGADAGLRPVMSRPSNRTRPARGRTRPLIAMFRSSSSRNS